jgi:hypothetical protein
VEKAREDREHEVELLFNGERPEVAKLCAVVEAQALSPVAEEEPVPDLLGLRQFGQQAMAMGEGQRNPVEQRNQEEREWKDAQRAACVKRPEVVGGTPRRD